MMRCNGGAQRPIVFSDRRNARTCRAMLKLMLYRDRQRLRDGLG